MKSISHSILILLSCMICSSCIKIVNLYESNGEDEAPSPKGTEVISEPFYFYTFGDEVRNISTEITLHLKQDINSQNISCQIPPLKYNKSWLFMLTQDDCKHSAYSCTWAAINGKPLSYEYFYDCSQLSAGDIPPNIYYLKKTLASTDGTGKEVRFAFTTTISPESAWMNDKTTINKGYSKDYFRFFMKSGLVWGNLKEMLNYGTGIAFHDVNTTNTNNVETIIEHYKKAQEITLTKLLGRGCKMLAEPNGNKTYVTAAQAYDPILTMTAQIGATKLYPYKQTGDLSKVLLERVFYTNPESIKDVVTSLLKRPKEDREALYVGVHGTDYTWVNFLSWLNDTYGQGGDDSVWFPSQEEYYEYVHYRTQGKIQVTQTDKRTIKIKLDLPGGEYFYYPSVTLNIPEISKEQIDSVSTDKTITGMSYGNFEKGIMMNIDCRRNLVELATRFSERYEKDKADASNKADAQYFINMLKDSDTKKELLKRLK